MRRVLLIATMCLTFTPLLGACENSDDTSAADQLACDIFRDIAANVDIQTIEETRSRIEDLYNGYGQVTASAIHFGLRDILEGLTSGDYDMASNGIRATDAACTQAGF